MSLPRTWTWLERVPDAACEGPPSAFRVMTGCPAWSWRGSRDGTHPEPVPPHLWPYGPPSEHQACCALFFGRNFCDCDASVNEEDR